ncbi:MAG: ABC transporter permease [Elusimicrobia bacterium]|nr:ABC transporter permease [Elusimicrobiota bacterium]
MTLVVGVVLLAAIGPLLLPFGPFEQSREALRQPSPQHLLGTDEVGRDLFARVLHGLRLDLIITLVAVPVATTVGTLLGLIGIVSRSVGAMAQRLFDVLLGVPAVIMGVAIALAITPGVESVIIAVVLVTMPVFGRQARTGLLSQLHQDYVAAARVLGVPRWGMLVRHILPNVVDAILIRLAVQMAEAIIVEGGLSVIGLGIQPPQPSLGAMIKGGSAYLFDVPTYALVPVLVVLVLVVGYLMVADALNQAVLEK